MKKLKRCKNKHPISRGSLVLLGHVVGVCTCGHRYLHSEILGTYVGDKKNELGEHFHTYAFSSLQVCGGCNNFITSIDIVCVESKKHEESWKKELTDLTEETPNETI